ncbi:MAG: bifunctional (p)ppGpp synthetase/guanosine-3',5'-bis(diphosphate) 3'-pyrophosphohydrolase, partial [Actinobacteria bacterium]|nr:bifunctional (p)ppGpp synthetase/guanosine-3',5'-bis(diphosphate) 3'-pyrophosphohydrolase [Actinomycetota bacterium]
MSASIDTIAKRLRKSASRSEIALLERAYETAERAHEGQQRKSGDPYITHPVAVAEILAELGLDVPTLIAALLHDTVEDTPYSLAEARKDFGDEVANLVDGVTKLDKLTYGPSAEAETVRKMVVAMSKDIRVLVIKLCDRLHNARTWKYVSLESAQRKAKETLEIYAPLANRLGINSIKWELEDLSFKTLEPKKYEEIERLIAERSPEREKMTLEVVEALKSDLKEERIKAEVNGRQKHLYSVYQKMVIRGREFKDIYDLVGVRILVEDVRDCYAVLGAVHARWSPVPGRFKDYIAMPKFNLYQSLHTTVIGPHGKAVEIQIRTYDMHARAEFGIAAHWKYKLSKDAAKENQTPDLLWLRQLHEWQQETVDANEFLDTLRYEVSSPEV